MNREEPTFVDKFTFRREVGGIDDTDLYIKKVDVSNIDMDSEEDKLKRVLSSFYTYLQELDFEPQKIVDITIDFFTEDGDDEEEGEVEELGPDNEPLTAEEKAFQKFLKKLVTTKDEGFFRALHTAYTLFTSQK